MLIVDGKFHGVSQYLMLSVFYFTPFVKLRKPPQNHTEETTT